MTPASGDHTSSPSAEGLLELLQGGSEVWNTWRSRRSSEEADTESAVGSIDLSGKDLGGFDLRGADLSGVVLSAANLAGADLTDAALTDSLLIGCSLSGATARGTNFNGADLGQANLDGADLRGATMIKSSLAGAQLEGARLDRADLTAANLGNASFAASTLTAAILSGSYGNRTSFVKADLTEVVAPGMRLEAGDLSGSCLRDADLSGARLSETDLQGADLTGADFEGCDATGASFRGADLKGANMAKATGLQADQLGGSITTLTKLPEAIADFKGVEAVKDACANARKIFLAMLLGCAYAGLTVGTTEDAKLIANSATAPLPIIQVPVELVGFYLVTPLVLVGFYLYLQLCLQSVWERIRVLPAVFPDGRRLNITVDPWLLVRFAEAHTVRLRAERTLTARVQGQVSGFLAWWAVPLTLLVVWARYLVRHDLHVSIWQLVLLVISALVGSYSYGRSVWLFRSSSLRIDENWRDRPIWRWTSLGQGLLFMGLVLVTLRVGMEGVGPKGAGPLRTFFRADLASAMVSERELASRTAPEADSLKFVKAADLRGADLRDANAPGAFLVRSNLRSAQLNRALLTAADLRSADLRGAILNGADLSYANLRDASLAGASLSGTVLTGANLSGTTGLSTAELAQACFSAKPPLGLPGEMSPPPPCG